MADRAVLFENAVFQRARLFGQRELLEKMCKTGAVCRMHNAGAFIQAVALQFFLAVAGSFARIAAGKGAMDGRVECILVISTDAVAQNLFRIVDLVFILTPEQWDARACRWAKPASF